MKKNNYEMVLAPMSKETQREWAFHASLHKPERDEYCESEWTCTCYAFEYSLDEYNKLQEEFNILHPLSEYK